MLTHFFRILVITAVLLACVFLPYMPGEYDSLATTLSFMAQLFGLAGLLLVPVGLLWLLYELSLRAKKNTLTSIGTYRFAVAAILTSCLVAFVISLGAFGNNNRSFGIFTVILCTYVVWKVLPRLKQLKNQQNRRLHPAPFYLMIIPLVIALFRLMFIEPATEFSRYYAIRQSGPLIADIETYYKNNGKYPVSLQALHHDYKPSMTGISQFYYERNGMAYNVYFKQFSDELDVLEIVMYNKLDEHAFAAHAMDILEYTNEELALRRGDRQRYPLSIPHWVYMKFE